jgi:hypothetical protein
MVATKRIAGDTLAQYCDHACYTASRLVLVFRGSKGRP